MTNYTDREWNVLLNFTNALADRLQDENKVDFGSMKSDEASLAEAQSNAVEFARRRNAGLSASACAFADADDEKELSEIKDSVKSWLKRTRRRING